MAAAAPVQVGRPGLVLAQADPGLDGLSDKEDMNSPALIDALAQVSSHFFSIFSRYQIWIASCLAQSRRC